MDLEQSAFEALRFASAQSLKLYKQPLVITYSGGKDSDVLLRLAINSGIPFDVLHSLTTADAPETVYHVRDTFRRLEEKGVKCVIDKVDAILLRRTKGGWRKRAICRDWCSLGRISKTERSWDAGSTTRRYKEAADADE